jgi:hypothetical protein
MIKFAQPSGESPRLVGQAERSVGSLDRSGPIPSATGDQHRDTTTLPVVMAARMAIDAARAPLWHEKLSE